ncbi:hypothetical protein B0H19DRAFT_1072037 [Mycena capillaripes]|nr:hypothetical protein B0H19DRAFT_1072037 [Mycena capillaripes]
MDSHLAYSKLSHPPSNKFNSILGHQAMMLRKRILNFMQKRLRGILVRVQVPFSFTLSKYLGLTERGVFLILAWSTGSTASLGTVATLFISSVQCRIFVLTNDSCVLCYSLLGKRKFLLLDICLLTPVVASVVGVGAVRRGRVGGSGHYRGGGFAAWKRG